jgi:hypothetical protein
MNHVGSTFLCGCAGSFELIFCAKELDELVEQDQENSSFFVMFGSDWYKYEFDGAWSAISMATVKPSDSVRTVVAVAPHGAYWEVEPKSQQEVHGEIRKVKYAVRGSAVVDNVIYACGMGRHVLRRNGPGDWDEIGPSTSQDDDGLIVGFEGLAGFSADEMYAVGWGGEIWQLAHGSWQRLDSPVSTKLNAVCCAADSDVYIVGDDGVMLRGRNEMWATLETERNDNLMDVAIYDSTVYVSTDFEILKLHDGVLVADDAFADPDDVPATCLHLVAAEDGLISMGTKDLFRLHGGVWERLV